MVISKNSFKKQLENFKESGVMTIALPDKKSLYHRGSFLLTAIDSFKPLSNCSSPVKERYQGGSYEPKMVSEPVILNQCMAATPEGAAAYFEMSMRDRLMELAGYAKGSGNIILSLSEPSQISPKRHLVIGVAKNPENNNATLVVEEFFIYHGTAKEWRTEYEHMDREYL